jgi:hypothetical protein
VGQIRIVINQAAFSSCLSRRSHLDCRARVMSLAADLRRPSPSTKAC